MSDIIKLDTTDSAKFLLTSGLLFEINRRVLHPFGLALGVNVDNQEGVLSDEESIITLGSSLINYSDDPEGMIFDEETLAEGSRKFRNFLKEFGEARLKSRAAALGYTIQNTLAVATSNFSTPRENPPTTTIPNDDIPQEPEIDVESLKQKNASMRQTESISSKLSSMSIEGKHQRSLGEDDDKSPGAKRAKKFYGISHKAPGTGKSCISSSKNTVYTAILGGSGIITCTDCGATLNDPDIEKD